MLKATRTLVWTVQEPRARPGMWSELARQNLQKSSHLITHRPPSLACSRRPWPRARSSGHRAHAGALDQSITRQREARGPTVDVYALTRETTAAERHSDD